MKRLLDAAFRSGRGLAASLAVLLAGGAAAQQRSVLGTVHNLSVSGPGAIRSVEEREVCKFCHIPHNAAAPEALWGHALSRSDYRTADLRRGRPDRQAAPQPDGSSRLCLSCHDGTVALGDINGGNKPIRMAGADRLGPGTAGFIGTDLSGSHPVSFAVRDDPAGLDLTDADIGLKPLGAIRTDRDVRLDAADRMQCTTCHDPHSDANYVAGKVPRFWVKPTIDEVCNTCHIAN